MVVVVVVAAAAKADGLVVNGVVKETVAASSCRSSAGNRSTISRGASFSLLFKAAGNN